MAAPIRSSAGAARSIIALGIGGMNNSSDQWIGENIAWRSNVVICERE